MAPHVQFLAHINWMWYKDEWMPQCIAFAPTYQPTSSIVVAPTTESLKEFTHRDVMKNLKVSPLLFGRKDGEDASWHRVDLKDLKTYLATEFYDSVLNNTPDDWDVKVGTYDRATFMYLEPLWSSGDERMVYLGNERDEAEHVALEQARLVDRAWTAL